MLTPSKVEFRIERNPPPPPKRRGVHYPFEEIPVGCAALVPRAANTVRRRLVEYRKQRDKRHQRFKIEAITQRQTRVWRIE